MKHYMKHLKDFITEAEDEFNGCVKSSRLSKLYDEYRNKLSQSEYDVMLIIENTRELWERYTSLMRSSLKHSDFDPEKCAESVTMSRIILAAVKKHNEACDSEDRLGRLSAEAKKNIGMCLVCRFES